MHSENGMARVQHVRPLLFSSGIVAAEVVLDELLVEGRSISRVHVLDYRTVQERGLGRGALVRISPAGSICEVVRAVLPELPGCCGECGGELGWHGDFLFCSSQRHGAAGAREEEVQAWER